MSVHIVPARCRRSPDHLGRDRGPNAGEYLLQALAACVTSTLIYHAAAEGSCSKRWSRSVEASSLALVIPGRNQLATEASSGTVGPARTRAIMAVQALTNPDQIAHLRGDVPALLVFAAVLAFLTPRGTVSTALAAGKNKYLNTMEET